MAQCKTFKPTTKRYVIWYTPVGRSTTIHGIAIGPMSLPIKDDLQLEIRGVNFEFFPASFLTLPGSMFGTMLALDPNASEVLESEDLVNTHVHGVSLSAGTFNKVAVYGLSLNLANSYSNYMKGVELTMFMNSHYDFNGWMFSMWGNRAAAGRGVQVGIFNTCDDCNVFQIGLLNRAGRRILPLINFGRGNNQVKRKRR